MEGRHVDGRAIRTLREKQGLFKTELAKKAGISVRYLKDIEGLVGRPNEPTRQPSAVVATRIALALGVDIHEFSSDRDEAHAGAA